MTEYLRSGWADGQERTWVEHRCSTPPTTVLLSIDVTQCHTSYAGHIPFLFWVLNLNATHTTFAAYKGLAGTLSGCHGQFRFPSHVKRLASIWPWQISVSTNLNHRRHDSSGASTATVIHTQTHTPYVVAILSSHVATHGLLYLFITIWTSSPANE